MSDISEGSVVQLKSGGPAMTVRWVEDGEAYCQWFSKDEENPHFPSKALISLS